jgi:arylsulfatase A-like enzyme
VSKIPSDQPPTRASTGLGLALLLGLGLLLVSFARLVGDVNSAAFDMKVIDTALTESLWRTRLGVNLLLFALAMLALHLGFGLLCWVLAWLTARAFPGAQGARRQWVLVWFVAGAFWLLLANAARFAHSSLGEPYHAMATSTVLGTTPYMLLTGCLLAGIATVLCMFLRRQPVRRAGSYLAVAGVALAAGAGFTWDHGKLHDEPMARPPNVFILGIDSMRPDYVNARITPHVHAFLNGAVQMQDAVTPLARTFPAWISILSGRHPHTTGAFMNLLPREMIHTGTTLPQVLRGHGYRTYYAMDETRFANIDATFGFDRSLTSTIGGSDFVISWFADTPLSNVVMNTWLGAWLFPHAHANRAAHVTYEPDIFVRRVASGLDAAQPVFLACHFTLPHWPYSWAATDPVEPVEENFPELYERAIHRADQQLGDLLAALQRRGLLDNAIVVTLSDHGEALGSEQDFMRGFYPDKAAAARKAQEWGHGTSVFSPTQYRVVLGIRGYGAAAGLFAQPATRSDPVSLTDVAPTLLDLLQIKSGEQFDGMSLASLLRTGPDTSGRFAERIRFTETEYNPQGLLSVHLTSSALAEAAKVYRLDSTTDRLLVREEALPSILQTRQYAALLGNRAMAIALPDGKGGRKHSFIYIPGPQGSSSMSPTDLTRLRQALRERFGIQFADTAPSGPT